MRAVSVALKNGWMLAGCVVLLCAVGRVQGGTGTRFGIATATQYEASVSAAFDGTNFLVGIQGDVLSHSRIIAQLISPTGFPVGGTADTGRSGGTPSVAFGGGIYLLVWGDDANWPDDDIYGQLVDTAGATVGSPFPICTATKWQGPSDLGNIGFDGTNFLVVWEDTRNSPDDDLDIYGRLVSTGGVLVASEIPIAIDNAGAEGGDDDDRFSSVAFDGTNYLVVFTAERRPGMYDGEDVYGQFVSTSGTLVGTNFVIDANDWPSPNPTAIAFDGTKYVVLFHDEIEYPNSTNWNIYARFVSPPAAVTSNRYAIAVSTNQQEQFPSIAFDGTHFLVTTTFALDDDDGFPTNITVNGRFFETNLNPVTPWFTIGDALGTNKFSLLGAPTYGGGKFLVLVPTVDRNFNFLDVYGVFVDRSPPEITRVKMTAGAVTLTVTNLFMGASNTVERTPSLLPPAWGPEGSFVSRSPQTNWSESAPSGLDGAFYRLIWK